MSCTKCFLQMQFPGILETDTQVIVNGGQYPAMSTVDNLVDSNPQFWWDAGMSGVKTLHTTMLIDGLDLNITVLRGMTVINVTAVPSFVGGRPGDR